MCQAKLTSTDVPIAVDITYITSIHHLLVQNGTAKTTYSEHGDAFLERDAQRGAQVLQGLHRILLRDQVQLVLELVGNAVEDVREQTAHHLLPPAK